MPYPMPGGAPALHLYTNEHDTVIAHDLDDAVKVLEEHNGASLVSGDSGKFEIMILEQIPDDKEIVIWCESGTDTPGVIDEGMQVTKTARDWALRGRGYLSCTEQ